MAVITIVTFAAVYFVAAVDVAAAFTTLGLWDILPGQWCYSRLSPQHYFCPSVKASEGLVGFVCPSAFFDVAGSCHRVPAAPQDQK